MTSNRQQEADRILEENARRGRELPADLYSAADPAHLFMRHGQERALLGALRREDLLPLGNRRILEVGCGTGRWLRFFVALGADRSRLAGIDLDRERLARGSSRLDRCRSTARRCGRTALGGRFLRPRLPVDDGQLHPRPSLSATGRS